MLLEWLINEYVLTNCRNFVVGTLPTDVIFYAMLIFLRSLISLF